MLIKAACLTLAIAIIFLARPSPGYPDTGREEVTMGAEIEKPAIQLTRTELEEDAQFAINTIKEVHPNPFWSVSQKAIIQLRDQLLRTAKEPVDLRQAYRAISHLVGALTGDELPRVATGEQGEQRGP